MVRIKKKEKEKEKDVTKDSKKDSKKDAKKDTKSDELSASASASGKKHKVSKTKSGGALKSGKRAKQEGESAHAHSAKEPSTSNEPKESSGHHHHTNKAKYMVSRLRAEASEKALKALSSKLATAGKRWRRQFVDAGGVTLLCDVLRARTADCPSVRHTSKKHASKSESESVDAALLLRALICLKQCMGSRTGLEQVLTDVSVTTVALCLYVPRSSGAQQDKVCGGLWALYVYVCVCVCVCVSFRIALLLSLSADMCIPTSL
jgi:Diaphanous GTPase-binding Domain